MGQGVEGEGEEEGERREGVDGGLRGEEVMGLKCETTMRRG